LAQLEELYPKMLWEVTDTQGNKFGENVTRYANFISEDYAYPGPFGAMCRVYGLPSYKTHFRDPEGVLRPIVRDMHTEKIREEIEAK
jgi:hypothetical protein